MIKQQLNNKINNNNNNSNSIYKVRTKNEASSVIDDKLYDDTISSTIMNNNVEIIKIPLVYTSIKHNLNLIKNIYTDDMLMKSMNSNNNNNNNNNNNCADGDGDDDDKIILLKIYNDNCRRCLDIENIFIDIVSSLNIDDDFNCLQARSIDIPSYMQEISHRLLGLRSTTLTPDDNIRDSSRMNGKDTILYDLICNICNNSGRVDCLDCDGKGYVMKGSIASFCSSCYGKKVIRCITCGGKCLNC